MDRKQTTILAIALALSLSAHLFASTTDFGAQDFLTEANKIKGFLFGPGARIAGVLGGGYGLIQAVLASSIRPLIVYGGIGLGVNLLPKFIDSVFVSGMLLP